MGHMLSLVISYVVTLVVTAAVRKDRLGSRQYFGDLINIVTLTHSYHSHATAIIKL